MPDRCLAAAAFRGLEKMRTVRYRFEMRICLLTTQDLDADPFPEDDWPGSADLCLAADPAGHEGFTRQLVAAALARHERRNRRVSG